MSLRACASCGSTLTDMFRFCPACGVSSDDSGWETEPKTSLSLPVVDSNWGVEPKAPSSFPFADDSAWGPEPNAPPSFPFVEDPDWGVEPKTPLSFPVVERASRTRRESRRTWWTRLVERVDHARIPSVAPAGQRAGAEARRILAAWGEAAGLVVQVVLLGVGSARDALRSMVLVRKLHAQRAAVIYSTGCAALNGDERRIRHARVEVEVLDELIAAAATRALSDVPRHASVHR